MNKETKWRIHNITAKVVLKLESEAWVLKKREEQRLELAQTKFLRRLLGKIKVDKQKNQCIRRKTGACSSYAAACCCITTCNTKNVYLQ